MQPVTARESALAFVDGLKASGGTNIHDALATALRGGAGDRTGDRPHTVVFVTDGLPTVGPVDVETIVAGARTAAGASGGAGPLRVFDPNVRPRLLPDAAAVAALRDLVEEFFATADLVKLSSADAEVLYEGASAAAAADRIRRLGARSVVVTCGAKGAYVAAADGASMLPAPVVRAVDATGAGDSVMGALVRRLLADGVPVDLAGWQRNVRFALAVAGLVCERPGGAVAMPTEDEVTARWGPLE